MVVIVEVRPTLLSGEQERFFLEDTVQVGDVVLVEDETVMDNELKMVGLETLVGYSVVTPGRDIGKLFDSLPNQSNPTILVKAFYSCLFDQLRRWIKEQQKSEGVTPSEDVYIILRLDARVRRSGRVSSHSLSNLCYRH
ncbi:hypothetical protein Tco_0363407 [Tanacetum coccineum]